MNAKKLGKFIAENDFRRTDDDLWLVSDFFRFLFLEVRKIGIFLISSSSLTMTMTLRKSFE